MKRITASIVVILCITALSACSVSIPFVPQPTETPTPTPVPSPTPMPAFQGTLLLRIRSGYSDRSVYRLVYHGDTWTTTSLPVIEGAEGALLAPDGRHLFVYQGAEREMLVIDLFSGEQAALDLPENMADMTSLSVSPAGTDLCYATATGRVYLYAIAAGKARLLHKAPSANYSSSDGTKASVYGETSCGPWLSPDRFMLYRYIGSMPRHVTFPGYPEVAANTTTTVTVGEKPKLENAKQGFSVEAVSADGLSVVYTDKKDGSVYLARNFSNFKEPDRQFLVQIAPDQTPFFEFLAGGQLLYTVSTGGLYPDYFIIDLADLEFREWELPDDCGNGLRIAHGWDGSVYQRSWQWIGEPGSGLIACVETDVVDHVAEVFVADVATGSATSVIKVKGNRVFAMEGEIIGWLPGDD